MNLYWRINLSLLSSALLAFLAVGFFVNRSVTRTHQEHVVADLTDTARGLIREMNGLPVPFDPATVDALCKELGKSPGSIFRVTVIHPDGQPIGDSDSDPAGMDNHASRPEFADALSGSTGRAERFSGTVRHPMAYVALPVLREGRVVAAVRAAEPVADIRKTLSSATRRVALGVLGTAVLFALLAAAVVRRFVQPIEEMRLAARRLAEGDLDARVSETSGGTEITALARSLNQMAHELDSRLQTITGQRNEMQAVLSSMSEGVLAVDTDGHILHFNTSAAKLLGLKSPQDRGGVLEEKVRHAEIQRFVKGLLSATWHSHADVLMDGDRCLRLTGAVLQDAAGKDIGALVVMADTTQLNRLERVRQDFVANVSHELKTPITALRAAVDTLADAGLKDADRPIVSIMGRQVDRLEATIRDLLSLARLEYEEQGGRVSSEPCPAAPLLKRAVAAFADAAREKNIAIEVDCPATLELRVSAELIEQAIGNLVDNAVKYSAPNTRVRVSAEHTGEAVFLRVRDEGPGIEARHLPRVFERFYRVDQARSRAVGGTGLGLAIVKHIALAHGGSVSVESTPGVGSAFSLRLPQAG